MGKRNMKLHIENEGVNHMNTACAIQFATKGIRYFGSLNTSSDSSNMLTTFSGHHSKVPDHLIQH